MSRKEHEYMAEQWDQLDPDRIEAEEKADQKQKRWRNTLEAQMRNDIRDLVRDPQFTRFMFTVLERAGIWNATCHAQTGAQYFDAGRRALGLEILDVLAATDPHIHIAMPAHRLKLMEQFDEAEKSDLEHGEGNGE